MHSPLRPLARRWILSTAGFLICVAQALAIIGATYQMQLGNPSGATQTSSNHVHYLIQRDQYAIDYNDTTREPNWVSWDLTTGDVGGSGRSDFTADPDLPTGFTVIGAGDYSGSGYDRGHMCPSADRTIDTANNKILFYMSNMIPQTPDNNQGVWASFETYCRTVAAQGNELLIVCGPSQFGTSKIASGVAIPGYVWKIVIVVPTGSGMAIDRVTTSTRVIAIRIPNIAGVRSDPWTNYTTSIAQIEADTGYAFLSALPSAVASALRTKVDGQTSTGMPVITSQPSSQTIAVGGSVTFSVTTTGDAPLSYQWLKDDTELTGQTGTSLTLSNVQAADAAAYSVQVTNNVGSATSNAAILSLSGLPPTITTGPSAQTAAAGSTVTFTVVAAGSPTLTYQWRKGGTALTNGTTVAGATTATLTLSNVQAANTAFYDVVVTNSVNTVTSSSATLNVTAAAPTIVTQPSAQSVPAGGTATFTVAARGTTPLSYAWRKGGTVLTNTGNVSGATTATLTLTGVSAADAANYDVVVSNGVGSPAPSNTAALTISTAAAGQLSYPGGTYSQNFNGLPSTGTFTLVGVGPISLSSAPISATGLDGWQLKKLESGTALFKIDTGTSNAGSVYSYGATGNTDRALGSIGSGTTTSGFGVVLVNSTGRTITEFTLSYTGEEWRNGGNTAAQKLTFAYGVGATDIGAGTFTTVTALDFTSPTATATAAALDGNAAANRTAVSATVTGLSWTAGQTLVLRWTDANDAGNDHALAIDDLSFTTPTPPSITASPGSKTVLTGTNTTLAVTAQGSATLTYQWRKDGTAILNNASATTATLTLSGLTAADAGSYDVLVTNGAGNATSDAATLTVQTPAQAWRLANFGSTTNSGAAADTADPDGDGVPNQLEYALGQNPNSPASATLPTGTLASGAFAFRFTRPISATDLTYTVQKSTDLLTWTTVASTVESSTATTETLVASLTATQSREFIRLNVGAVTTVPVGYMSVVLTSGATNAFGIPLEDASGPLAGLRAAKVESFTDTTLTNSAGGWSPGVLGAASAPWAARFTSGNAAGRLVDLAGNTATTLTIKNASLAALGVAVGDTFELVPIDTLNTFWDGDPLLGATTSAAADLVKVFTGSIWTSYYYNSTAAAWRLAVGPTTSYNNVALRPGSGFQVTRRGATKTVWFTGRVLATSFRQSVPNAGGAVITSGYPTDTTLGALALQTLIPGWRSGTSAATADQACLFNGSAWIAYVFNGSNWQALANGANANTTSIPAGAALLLQRPGTTSGTTDLVRNRPY